MSETFSAGVLLYRESEAVTEVLLGHMGGPFWAKKDASAWTLPKGEYDPDGEDAQAAAAREFTEELGLPVPEGEWSSLGAVRYRSGRNHKNLTAWAVRGELDPAAIVPGTFDLEWPPRSGKITAFPELDRVEWFDLATAREKLGSGPRPFLDRLARHLGGEPG
ncbi:NUDIX domain-containing protein [Nocardia asteroides]|uniref:NUDIX domain-containing protein n=1 Tax=Nocardia asteroides TaxID=1824 RepID=UPI001E60E1F6|nr:NUDIX domain-containing protein [Nocardia asteroides]UGT60418.1 NUDIX domain-containing protein [Nocardia asteroides]